MSTSQKQKSKNEKNLKSSKRHLLTGVQWSCILELEGDLRRRHLDTDLLFEADKRPVDIMRQ